MQPAETQSTGTNAVSSLLALTIVVAVAFVLADAIGFQSYIILAAMGLFALAGAALVFVRPRWGVYFMAFYVYGALNFYPGGRVGRVGGDGACPGRSRCRPGRR